MCGIFGITNLNEESTIKAELALHTLAHRGPDQSGFIIHNQVFLGHQRLSIIDTSEQGRQPFFDGKVFVTVNGEIYNYKALKSKLIHKYNFRSNSDSEVVLHGYNEWGVNLFKKMEGMFAVSIYDTRTNTIILSRDPYGVKPLFYGAFAGQLIWSSELKAIEKYYGKKLDSHINFTALYDFLTYGYIPTPKTMYSPIFKLEPASYLVCNLNDLSYNTRKYWSLNIHSKSNDNYQDASLKVRSLLSSSLEEQLESDVPLGFFLSGGIDSSALVALATNDLKISASTFTIAFPDTKKDESMHAEKVAQYYTTNHHVKPLVEGNIKPYLSQNLAWFDEPFADSSAFSTFAVCELAQKYVKVAISGDGGDELFGGYNWYAKFVKVKKSFFRRSLAQFFQSLTRILNLKNLNEKLERYFSVYLCRDDMELYTILMGGMIKKDKYHYRNIWKIPDSYDDYWYFRKYYHEDIDPIKRLQILDFHTFLPDDIFTKVDRTSMACGLECRVPFMNKKLVEYAFSLSIPHHILAKNPKIILKAALRDLLPSEILKRGKQGFSLPTSLLKSRINPRIQKQVQLMDEFLRLKNENA